MSLLPVFDGAFGDPPDMIEVDGEASSWSELAGRADALASEIGGANVGGGCGDVDVRHGGRRRRRAAGGSARGAGSGRRRPDGAAATSSTTRARRWSPGSPTGPSRHCREWRSRRPVSSPAGRDVDERAAALIMYTSGTTGPPKGAVLSRAAIAADLDGLADAWAWTADDTLVHGLPLFHVHGLVLGVLGALRVGSRLVHTGRPLPERYAAARGSLYFGVPTVWSRMVGEPKCAAALSPARLLVSGSAALPVPVFEQIRALTGHTPIERYGMTETLITISTRHDGERRPGHVGVPITGVESRLRSDDGGEVAHDGETIGGLQMSGATMFDGYLNLPEKTAESFTDDGWFVTGDSATIGPDGFHRIVGRSSIDIIKSGGFKVGAGEVESVLLSHPAVVEVAVVGLPDADLGERIVAFVVGDVSDSQALIDHVAAELSVHKRPREIRVVESLPRNAMGKVQKQHLRS